MGAAKKQTVKRLVNRGQPAEILKRKQKTTVKALLAEQRRQEQMRREFELFLAAQSTHKNDHTNWYFPEEKRRSQRKTRRLRQ